MCVDLLIQIIRVGECANIYSLVGTIRLSVPIRYKYYNPLMKVIERIVYKQVLGEVNMDLFYSSCNSTTYEALM